MILSIDGQPVYNNGYIKYHGEMVNMNEVVERKFAGDKVKMEILRDRKKQNVELTLKRFLPYLTMGEQYNQRPRYLLYAGLLFQPMNRNLMEAHSIRDSMVNYVFDNYLSKEIYKERAATAECVNAQARNRGLQRLPVRGLGKVRCVAKLYALAHNLMRMVVLAPHLLGLRMTAPSTMATAA